MTHSLALAFWDKCLLYFENRVPERAYKTWIKPIEVSADEPNTLILTAPNRHIREFFTQRYLQEVKQLLSQENLEINVLLKIPAASVSSAPTEKSVDETKETSHAISPSSDGHHSVLQGSASSHSSPTKEQIVTRFDDTTGLNKSLTFDNLVIGKANELAFSTAAQVIENPGKNYNPFFIYGETSLGKTHLVQAIANKMATMYPHFKIRYIDSETLYREYFKATTKNAIDEYKHYFQTLDFFIIDDIQFLSKKFGTQNELFHTFNALLARGKQIIITSDRYPADIQELEPRIVSRFGGGLTVSLEPPELEMRVSILHKKSSAPEISLKLTDEAAFFMAKHIRSNVRELEGALHRVHAFVTFARLAGIDYNTIGIDVIREALSDILHKHNALITIESIQKIVADRYGIKVSDMYSKTRQQKIVRPRQIAMSLARDLTQYSLPQIGESFGGRDHTTVIHACKAIEKLRSLDQSINHEYHLLRQTLKGGED